MITLEQIIEAVLTETGVDITKDNSRSGAVVDAKRIYGHLACRYTPKSLNRIGKPIKRCHAMILHYKNTCSDFLETDKRLRNSYENIEKEINNKYKKKVFSREEVNYLIRRLKNRSIEKLSQDVLA